MYPKILRYPKRYVLKLNPESIEFILYHKIEKIQNELIVVL